MRKEKGFTLIELLVVIAIIGILSAMVLVSLSTARNRAKDGRIESAMAQLRTSTELYSSDKGSYSGTPTLSTVCAAADCTTYTAGTPEKDICTLCKDIDTQNGTNGGTPTYQATSNEYCAYVALATSSTKYFCIDEGRAIETTTNPNTTCLATAWNCPAS